MVRLSRFKLVVLIETKIYIVEYFCNWFGYKILCYPACPDSAGRAQGGVGLVSRDWPMGWSLESTRFQVPKVVSCKVVIGTSRTPIAVAYH